MTQDTDQRLVLVNAVIIFLYSIKGQEFLDQLSDYQLFQGKNLYYVVT
jgi:hypothetical protein